MDTPGYVVLSRMSSQLRALDALANNLANVDTPGYQAQRPLFSRFLQPRPSAPGIARETGVNYAIDRATWRETQPGPLATTGNPLDLALRGDGFFAVETPQGERFTRNGRFTLSPERELTDAEGNAVLDDRGRPITFGAADTRIEVMGDGTVRSENGVLGKLRIVRFEGMQALRPEGNQRFATDEPPVAVERPGVIQGAVEGSNVQTVLELNRITRNTRAFQGAVNFADAENDRLKTAVERILRSNA
jgi:flagellar basal-body rod protein FlgF